MRCANSTASLHSPLQVHDGFSPCKSSTLLCRWYVQSRGIPQGSVTSSFLCNLYLSHLQSTVLDPLLTIRNMTETPSGRVCPPADKQLHPSAGLHRSQQCMLGSQCVLAGNPAACSHSQASRQSCTDRCPSSEATDAPHKLPSGTPAAALCLSRRSCLVLYSNAVDTVCLLRLVGCGRSQASQVEGCGVHVQVARHRFLYSCIWQMTFCWLAALPQRWLQWLKRAYPSCPSMASQHLSVLPPSPCCTSDAFPAMHAFCNASAQHMQFTLMQALVVAHLQGCVRAAHITWAVQTRCIAMYPYLQRALLEVQPRAIRWMRHMLGRSSWCHGVGCWLMLRRCQCRCASQDNLSM